METRVALQRVRRYDQDEIEVALAAALKPFGGISAFVKPGQRVLLKVNTLMPSNPKNSVTTHPAVVSAVAKAVLLAGATPIIADSPGGPYQPKLLEATYRATGLWDMATRLGVELNLDCSSFELEAPNSRLVHRFVCIKPVLDADVIFSLCKLKTHGFMMYTGAVKNLFGVIPGMAKSEFHLKMPREADFAAMLVDLCEAIQPDLSIMDGIMAMEGDGPSGGKPRLMQSLLVSPNPHALDLTACGIIALKPDQVPTLQEALLRNLIPQEVMDLDLYGEPLVNLAVNDFLLPQHRLRRAQAESSGVRGRIGRMLSNRLRPHPVFSRRKCVRCGRCLQSCPPQCLTMGARSPRIDLGRCIRCYCCHELCPAKAIRVNSPGLARWIFKQ
ncbi:MAG: DUF362 domain-containing protein [Symbiobacteriaceae bacterium]|nr:DUF362 domain-containing protein [Symbiobacteriaceae bacterium]